MPNRSGLEQSLVNHGIGDKIIDEIINISYKRCKDENQNVANYFCKAMKKCDELVDFDVLSEVMGEMCCCKTGSMDEQSRTFAKVHSGRSLDEKMKLLEHISQPWYVDDHHIVSYITGEHETVCSCWVLKGRTPEDDTMPLSYCLCCAGFLKYHYEKALGVKLRVDKMISSILNGDKRCAAVFEIL